MTHFTMNIMRVQRVIIFLKKKLIKCRFFIFFQLWTCLLWQFQLNPQLVFVVVFTIWWFASEAIKKTVKICWMLSMIKQMQLLIVVSYIHSVCIMRLAKQDQIHYAIRYSMKILWTVQLYCSFSNIWNAKIDK